MLRGAWCPLQERLLDPTGDQCASHQLTGRGRLLSLTCLSSCWPWISTKSPCTFTVRSSGEKCFTSRKMTNLSRSDRT